MRRSRTFSREGGGWSKKFHTGPRHICGNFYDVNKKKFEFAGVGVDPFPDPFSLDPCMYNNEK